MSKKIKIAISAGLILSFSLTTIWSTTPNLFFNQLAFLILGIFVVLLFYRLDLGVLFSISPIFYIVSIILLVATLLLGEPVRGATRWLGPLQTSEAIKPLLTIFYANFLVRHDINKIKNLLIYWVLALIPVILIKVQPDLGSALVILSLAGLMATFAGLNKKTILLLAVSFIVLIPIAPKILKNYQLDRIESFINPESDPKGTGYNVIQSVIAIGSGGILGKGVRLGTQSHLNFLPERHTDFIFASFAEEFGLVGIFMALAAYYYLFSNFFEETANLKEKNAKLLHLGIVWIFFFQVVVNIGMNLGLMPVTGITLPLFSYGGSSLISFMALLGLSANLLELTPRFKI